MIPTNLKKQKQNQITNPYSITDLIKLANVDHICKQQLHRSINVEELYTIYRNNIPKYFNFNEYIFKNNNTNYVIKLNDFPYDVEPDIIHYVLWLPNYDYTHDEIQNIINNEFIGYKDVVWFINSKKFRSVHSIYHAHVFVN